MVNLSLVLSGGNLNKFTDYSLGGYPSPIPINPDKIDNLFNTVPPAEIGKGRIDYKCIYLFNDDEITFYNFSIKLIMINPETYSKAYWGFKFLDEQQTISIEPYQSLTGTFKLSIDNLETNSIDASTLEDTESELETELKRILDNDITITKSISGNKKSFNITFNNSNLNGRHKSKYFPLIEVSEDLIDAPKPTILVKKNISGSPINTIADVISSDNIVPNGISFYSSNVKIGSLKPNEGFPIWLKRVVYPNSPELTNDGFKFVFKISTGANLE